MSESLDRIERIYNEALRRPPGERNGYLQEACGGDDGFRAEVDTLLRAQAGGKLPEAPGNVPSATEPLEEAIGARVGPYRLLERLGEGGYGTVYLAEQTNPIRRRVALKVIKLGMDTVEVIARFEAERQTLALMEHPNIARVFECGATARGRPYFVMELVRGAPITRFCDERQLTLVQRLEQCVPVCRAIHHAHERGVIHRDIKPSNVLVAVSDDPPTPKVIDFGIAKATEGSADGRSLTAVDQVVGTPLYMSPEQAAVGSAGTDSRSDIYSLGVLLYELTTGSTPFERIGEPRPNFDEVRRRVLREDALSPSRRLDSLPREDLGGVAAARGTTPARLLRAVRGDLDWVIGRCLEKDSALRYSTAKELAEELERYIRREPVLAAGPGPKVRLRRFARRHRRAGGIVGTAAALMLAGAGALMWMRSERVVTLYSEREMAELVSARSIAVLPFSNRSSDSSDRFFAEGVHEDLIDNLAKIHDLRVTSRVSVMAYRNGPRDLRAIGRQLNVRYLLQGSVQRQRDDVRVSASLRDATTGEEVWSGTYARPVGELSSIESEMAELVARTMGAEVTAGEHQLIGRRPTGNPSAYALYLRARALDDQLGSAGATAEEYQPVLELYGQALVLDPNFTLAYVEIATVNLKLYWYSELDSNPSRLAQARSAIAAAVRLAPDEPETHLALGHLEYNVELDWRRALREFQAAEAGMPNDDQVLFGLGMCLRRLGRWSEAADSLARATIRNPQSNSLTVACIETMSLLRRYPQACEYGLAAASRFPESRALAEWALYDRYEIDGDRAAFLRGWQALPRSPDDPIGIFDRYQAAIFRSDWSSADAALSDSRLTRKADFIRVTVDPVSLYRAMVACLRGNRVAAGNFADDAIAYYRNGFWTPRQRPWVLEKIAEAEAYAGRGGQAMADAKSAWNQVAGRDAFDAAFLRTRVARVFLVAGDRPEALELLKEALKGPCPEGPRRIRLDPFWSRLAGETAFEAALRPAGML